jgi:photosystem II stability/assembly factor-like uncharacterized protein
MKTKIYLTMLSILMSIQIVIAQQVSYGDQIQSNVSGNKIVDSSDLLPTENTTIHFTADEVALNNFRTKNNTLIACSFIPGSDNNIICSTNTPVNGWGMMVAQDNGKYTLEKPIYKDGAEIHSIAFTDSDNGWAVGVMNNYSSRNGVIFYTEDGGITWNLQTITGTGTKLNKIEFTDSKNGQVLGNRTIGDTTFKIMLITTNSGEVWKQQNMAQFYGEGNSSEPSMLVIK